jgi:hypothetical protein
MNLHAGWGSGGSWISATMRHQEARGGLTVQLS